MNEQIKEATLKTYQTKIKSMVGKEPQSIMMIYEPEITDAITVSINIEDHPMVEDIANKKDSIFLKRLVVPKLKKELKSKHDTKNITLTMVTCMIEFKSSQISLFAEYYFNIKNKSTYYKKF